MNTLVQNLYTTLIGLASQLVIGTKVIEFSLLVVTVTSFSAKGVGYQQQPVTATSYSSGSVCDNSYD